MVKGKKDSIYREMVQRVVDAVDKEGLVLS